MGHVNKKSLNMNIDNSNFIIFTTIKIFQKCDTRIIERKKIIVYYLSDLGSCQMYVSNDNYM